MVKPRTVTPEQFSLKLVAEIWSYLLLLKRIRQAGRLPKQSSAVIESKAGCQQQAPKTWEKHGSNIGALRLALFGIH